METAANIGFWFLIGLLCIIVLALSLGIYYRLSYRKPRRQFLARARADFQKQFPYLNAESFVPIITLPSPCCKKMLWLYNDAIRDNYFCDHCGKRYMKRYSYDLKQYTDELDYFPYEKDLSALNESYKFWATATKNPNP